MPTMATRKKKNPKQKDEQHAEFKADKRDYNVAKYMHKHAPKRIGDLHGMEVECFFAEEAINTLLDSPWATGKDCIFTDRQSIEDYCHEMLCKELFHRATLVKRKPKPAKVQVTDGNETPGESGTEGKKKKKKGKDEADSAVAEATPPPPADDKPKKVKKLKLEMCEEQAFYDGREVYVWIYEPVSWTKGLIGTGILVGAILVCCYPLWPEWMRTIVYYISLAGAGFLGFIIVLAIVRYIVWGIVYAITFGKHSFFLFPNLLEDCGFFESFVPAFEYSLVGEEPTKKIKNSDKDGEGDKTDDAGADPAVEAAGEAESAGAEEGSDKSRSSSENDFEVLKQ